MNQKNIEHLEKEIMDLQSELRQERMKNTRLDDHNKDIVRKLDSVSIKEQNLYDESKINNSINNSLRNQLQQVFFFA